MGTIRTEVSDQYLSIYPAERDLLLPFLDGFHVTWATKKRGYNTELSVFFLSPEDHYKESYGFENEVLLVYSPYKRMEPRTLQTIEQVFSASPAKGRVETLNYFLISDCDEVKSWLESYVSSRQETRIIVSFTKSEIISAKGDTWFLRNKLEQQFFGRDLFNYSLPLVEDTYFFGRQNITMDYYDAVRRSENKAIFGLRKTGKTSLLFKLRRLCEAESLINVFYYDCKLPHIRKSRWFELLKDISSDISAKLEIGDNLPFDERTASKSFIDLIKNAHEKGHKICLIFDEIEYISFISPKDPHWKTDFIDFWQTLWSCQSQFKCLSFLIAGVNPSVVETDLIDNVQNPLFGIVPHKYLTGFNIDELKMMLKKLGKRMGITFTPDACEAIRKWYGGHPLLTRQACSTINSFMSNNKKPFNITTDTFREFRDRIDQELTFYSNHAISEIRAFYPDEYYLFELLATGRELEFRELSKEAEYIKHLCSYQLIREGAAGYEINIPVVAQRVAMDSKKQDGRELIYPMIDGSKRNSWLKRRIEEISADLNVLEKLIAKFDKPNLFGVNSFPEGVQFNNICVVDDVEKFSSFINTLNRCFVESIERYGNEIIKNTYFWTEVKSNYQYLWPVLHRIKVYRHHQDHLQLNKVVADHYDEYISEDLEGRSFSQVEEPYFLLQQRILDRFLLGIQREIDIIS